MIFIAHRGRWLGEDFDHGNPENSPELIDEAIHKGFDVEVDVWKLNLGNELWLGHDKPEFRVTMNFFLERSKLLWIHAKNLIAFNALIDYAHLNVFFHDKDQVVLTSKGNLWHYPTDNFEDLSYRSILVMPEWFPETVLPRHILGICSDQVGFYRQAYKDKNSGVFEI